MATKPQKPSMKERLAATAAKRDAVMSTNSDVVKEASREVEEAIPSAAKTTPKTLPKVTLYAHKDVLKAVRLLAVEDGVQAQEILRTAVRDYLAARGHHFSDLTKGT